MTLSSYLRRSYRREYLNLRRVDKVTRYVLLRRMELRYRTTRQS